MIYRVIMKLFGMKVNYKGDFLTRRVVFSKVWAEKGKKGEDE